MSVIRLRTYAKKLKELMLSFTTGYSKSGYNPKITNHTDLEEVVWKDNLGNEVQAQSPGFDYSSITGDKTLEISANDLTKVYSFDFLPSSINDADALIKGTLDLSKVKNIRRIDFAGSPITGITLSDQTNEEPLYVRLSGTDITTLDLSKSTHLTHLTLGLNPNLKAIFFGSTSASAISLDLYSKPFNSGSGYIELLDTMDLTPFTGKPLSAFTIGRTSLLSIDLSMFSGYSGKVYIENGNVTESINLSKYTGNDLSIRGNSNLTSITFPSTSVIQTSGNFWIYENSSLKTLDLSWLKKTTVFSVRTNALTTIIFPVDATEYDKIDVQQNNLSSLDISGIAIIRSRLYCYQNPNLSAITFPAAGAMDGVKSFWAYSCSFSNFVFPFGTVLKPESIAIYNNNMDQATVDANIDSIYQNRANFPTVAKVLNIAGTNASPSSAAITQINDLEANYNWTITYTAP